MKDKDNPFQDLDKAIWYISREILKRKKEIENEKEKEVHNSTIP